MEEESCTETLSGWSGRFDRRGWGGVLDVQLHLGGLHLSTTVPWYAPGGRRYVQIASSSAGNEDIRTQWRPNFLEACVGTVVLSTEWPADHLVPVMGST